MNISPKHSKDARAILGLSQSTVAKEAQVNRTYLSGWENESKILPDSALIRLKKYYDSMGYEFPAEDEGQEAEVVASGAHQVPAAQPTQGKATTVQPAKPAQPKGKMVPAGMYMLDGYVIPGGIRQGTAENILQEVADNQELIGEFLADEEKVSATIIEGGFFSDDVLDETSVEDQKEKSAHAVALMARNYLLLTRLRGSLLGVSEAQLTRGRCADCDETSEEFDQTNVGVVSAILDRAYRDRAAISVPENV